MKPRIEFSGVRSSWLVLDRKAFLAWFALSASSLAATSCALRLASSFSALASESARRPISSSEWSAGTTG